MRKTIAFSAGAAAAAAVLVGVVVAKDEPGRAAPETRVSLRIFEEAQRPSDRLPAAFIEGPIGRHFRSSDSRRLGRYRGITWYAVPGRHHTICLAGITHGETFGPCPDADMLSYGAIWIARQSGPNLGGPNLIVAGIATDGLQRVRWSAGNEDGAAAIRRNAFFLTVPREKPATLRLLGPDVETHVVELGNGPIPPEER
jgi:hypothetical protein